MVLLKELLELTQGNDLKRPDSRVSRHDEPQGNDYVLGLEDELSERRIEEQFDCAHLLDLALLPRLRTRERLVSVMTKLIAKE